MPAATPSAPVTHYENFPVASWLCPVHLRPAVAAIYHFARFADDIADEGNATAAQRLEQLHQYRQALDAACSSTPYPADGAWAAIMRPLQSSIAQHQLPTPMLHDLLTAFERDIAHTAQASVYLQHSDLLDYSRYSATPVGRLMLHLYGVHTPEALQQSDAICTALQLFNFWQDISVDVARGRYYLPQDLCTTYGVDPKQPQLASATARQQLLFDLLHRARQLMHQGMPLPRTVQQSAGKMVAWELRLVIQGGLRIGQKTQDLAAQAFVQRPKIKPLDTIPMLLSALRM